MPTTMDGLRALRIDVLDGHDAAQLVRTHFAQWLGNFATSVLYREAGAQTGKVHLQGYVTCADGFKERKRELQAMLTSLGYAKHQWSFTAVKKVENYMRYVAKDKDCVHKHGISDEVLSECEKQSYRKKCESYVAHVYMHCLAHGLRDRCNIVQYIVEEHAQRDAPIRVFYVRAVANTVQWKLDVNRDELIEECLRGF